MGRRFETAQRDLFLSSVTFSLISQFFLSLRLVLLQASVLCLGLDFGYSSLPLAAGRAWSFLFSSFASLGGSHVQAF
ncbi:hypothetical protein BKA81DRAFT_20484 [Phyllosticta paracitricarpa]